MEVAKFRPISLLNTGAKLLGKALINRIMHFFYTKDLLNNNQYGFTPQTSTVDASMAVKKFVEESLQNGQYVVLVSLDVQGAFDAALWPSILNALRELNCPKKMNIIVFLRCSWSRKVLTLQRDISTCLPHILETVISIVDEIRPSNVTQNKDISPAENCIIAVTTGSP
jgi:hypothetical protein